jgi:hypothetical protein
VSRNFIHRERQSQEHLHVLSVRDLSNVPGAHTLDHPSLHIRQPDDGTRTSGSNGRHRLVHRGICGNMSSHSPRQFLISPFFPFLRNTYHQYFHARSPQGPNPPQPEPGSSRCWRRARSASIQMTAPGPWPSCFSTYSLPTLSIYIFSKPVL